MSMTGSNPLVGTDKDGMALVKDGNISPVSRLADSLVSGHDMAALPGILSRQFGFQYNAGQAV